MKKPSYAESQCVTVTVRHGDAIRGDMYLHEAKQLISALSGAAGDELKAIHVWKDRDLQVIRTDEIVHVQFVSADRSS